MEQNVFDAVVKQEGFLYFACEKGSHCSSGQKIQVEVVAASEAPPAPPLSEPPIAPPPQDSGGIIAGAVGGAVGAIVLLAVGTFGYYKLRGRHKA